MSKIIPPQIQTREDQLNRGNELRRDTDKNKNITRLLFFKKIVPTLWPSVLLRRQSSDRTLNRR